MRIVSSLGPTSVDALVTQQSNAAAEAVFSAYPDLMTRKWTETSLKAFIEDFVYICSATYGISTPRIFYVKYDVIKSNAAILRDPDVGVSLYINIDYMNATTMNTGPEAVRDWVSVIFHEMTHAYDFSLPIDDFALGTPEHQIAAINSLAIDARKNNHDLYMQIYNSIFFENHAYFAQQNFASYMDSLYASPPPSSRSDGAACNAVMPMLDGGNAWTDADGIFMTASADGNTLSATGIDGVPLRIANNDDGTVTLENANNGLTWIVEIPPWFIPVASSQTPAP